MKIKLATYAGNPKKVGKNVYFPDTDNMAKPDSGVIKADECLIIQNAYWFERSSMLRPHISITAFDSVSTNLGSELIPFDVEELTQYNYCYIPKFDRFYFVREPFINQNAIEFDMEVDVLETFAKSIKKSSNYVLRQENDYSAFYFDEHYPVKYGTGGVVVKSFPKNKFTSDAKGKSIILTTTGCGADTREGSE